MLQCKDYHIFAPTFIIHFYNISQRDCKHDWHLCFHQEPDIFGNQTQVNLDNLRQQG